MAAVSEALSQKLQNNTNSDLHSGDSADSDDASSKSPKRTEESEDAGSENEVEDSKKSEKQVKGGASSEDSEEDKKHAAKKEKKAPVVAESKKNGTTNEVKLKPPLDTWMDLDQNSAERVKSEGRRERKQVERFSIPENVKPQEEKLVITSGNGEKLGDLPAIAELINKALATDLRSLHRFFFGRAGQTHSIKKNLRLFSGFPFDDLSPEYQKKKNLLQKMESKKLKEEFCHVLTLSKGGTKEQLVERVLEFTLKPVDTGVKPKQSKAKKASKSKSPKSKTSRSKSSSGKSKSKGSKKSASKPSSISKSSEDDDDDEDASPSDKEDKKIQEKRRSVSDDEEEEPPKKKGRETGTRQAAAGKRYAEDDEEEYSEPEKIPKPKNRKSSPVKSKSSAPPPGKRSRKDSSADEESNKSESESEKEQLDSDEEEEERQKKSKSKGNAAASKKTKPAPKPKATSKPTKVQDEPSKVSRAEDDDSSTKSTSGVPSEEEIKSFLVKHLKTANLKKVTMKTILQDVQDKYPTIDMVEKKSIIKGFVNEILEPGS